MGIKINSLSVFFPAYNEEENISQTVKKASKILAKLLIPRYEIIVIDDGSTDKTAEIVKTLQGQDRHIRLISHPINQGYGEALKSGFYNARYDWIVFTDSDGQFDFSEITKFLDKINEADIVIGYRINRQDRWIRKLLGIAWTLLANLLLGIEVKDVDCGFKLIKKQVIKAISPLESSRGGMISPELLAKAKKTGFKITEVGVHHYPRTEGQQTGANLKVILYSFIDLIRLWWKLR